MAGVPAFVGDTRTTQPHEVTAQLSARQSGKFPAAHTQQGPRSARHSPQSAECLMYTNSHAHPGVAMDRASTPTSRYSQVGDSCVPPTKCGGGSSVFLSLGHRWHSVNVY